VARTEWVDFLAEDKATRSCTSVCLKIADPWFGSLAAEQQAAVAKSLADRIEKEGVAYDIAGYRDAPPGIRIWCGATVEKSDVEALLPWLDWAFAQVKAEATKTAA
jgi:phosphoserine aminotransferase